ncbi:MULTISPECIES: winged helix-turn-helix domain-containing protein [unclassified Mesorhizobium]|uniref:winged helix-turn-helix domain-containing protein n=1 Tax=unclassified Mesorhizobium TaxID=325217 RepID=UPI000BAEC960|nr:MULTISPECIES: winged helix-turn-helix domain-containing protein [unclassified Mesorhizobium]TGT61012.1 tetratricopeptide repeat protein [Mesorhizobium sp. M00.F.Ca.ET.170.01.1.1]AZO08782.1 tetratricopeptide repeat protein [Mesorhizobium sp. M3A.F.Ca.ET.080.04.2.1]PBB84071.1 transcriptional regulator [Mesorhizobium sp. WSM3876]RWB72093.1 MAG: tetratricopeptide repeat protein [Mesorhizobium sp.]RWB83701.1 MAG: tetratricopeptide repeat protein [Mesorhizobium sp.]
MAESASQGVLQLGACQLDLERGLLLRDGAAVPLRSKAFSLLSYLARNDGKVVTKSDLISAVWGGIAVTEDSLTQAVRDIRKALDDGDQAILKAVPKRGYLLSAPSHKQHCSQPVVAVVPFEDGRAPGETSDALSSAFAEDVADRLARFHTLTILNRETALAAFRQAQGSGPAIALRPDFFVRGTVIRDGGQLRISAKLVDAQAGTLIWGESYTAAGPDLFAVQDDIAHRVVNRLVSNLEAAALRRSAGKPTQDLAAYELVTRAIVRFRGYRPDDNAEALKLLKAAVSRDPDYGLAHAYMALVELAIADYGSAPAHVIASCVDRAALAVTLAPDEPRCHRILAQARLAARDHEAAEHHMRRALDINPNDADTMMQLGHVLCLRGRPREGLELMDRAIAANPLHADWYHCDRGIALYAAHDYAGAAATVQRLPYGPRRWSMLAAALARSGDRAGARECVMHIRRTDPGFSPIEHLQSGIEFERAQDIEHLIEGFELAAALAV